MRFDLRIKAGLLAVFVVLMAISFYRDDVGGAIFFMIPALIMVLLVNCEIQTIAAADKIRKMISGMGYSSNETEELTWRVISILKEEAAKKPVNYSNEHWSNWLPMFAASLTKWANFTQSDFASAFETAIVLKGKNR